MKELNDIEELASFPAFGSSMAGGNMVTNKNPHFAGQGTDSEATHDIVAHEVDWVGYSHDTPGLPGPEPPAGDLDTDEKGTSYSPAPRTWKDLG